MKNKRIEKTLNYIESDSIVLDVGCVHHDAENYNRDDWIHKHIVKKSNNVLGIDIEVAGIEYLKEKGFNIEYCDIESSDFPKSHLNCYDVINAGELIEHLSNPGKFLEHCAMMLKNNGVLILSTPNVWNYFNIVSAILRARVPVHEQHTCWYDKRTLYQLLSRHGFRSKKFEYLPMSGGRGSLLGNFMQIFGLEMIGGEALFIVAEKYTPY